MMTAHLRAPFLPAESCAGHTELRKGSSGAVRAAMRRPLLLTRSG